jgi:hypothetical protein
VKQRIVAAVIVTFALLGFGAAAAFAGSSDETDPASQPTLAQTGYDFTPMLVTAAVFLLIAGITVVVAKYALARSSHS